MKRLAPMILLCCGMSFQSRLSAQDGNGPAINSYAAVLSIDICTNTLTVDDPATFNVGDTVVIMQMKGASIDSANTVNFGTITSLNNAGRYEFNYIKSKTGNTIEFKNTFLSKYDVIKGRVQLVRVPYFQSFTVNSDLTCPAWDGKKGGVIILNSATDVTLNAGIDVSKKGFRGGAVGGGFSCNNINNWAAPLGIGGTKGEGVTEYISGFEAGGARLGNGGGGAYAANSGGGGGGNFGGGGLGGFHSNTCNARTQSMGGYTNLFSNNRVFLGGGGGGGQEDNNQPVAAGGNGGGIVIIKAQSINGNNQLISADGEDVTTLVRDEGGAGGGAGGSVLLFTNNINGLLRIGIKGGNGSSNENQVYPTRCHGPGGGGGGGYLGYSLPASSPITVSENGSGGKAGFILNPASACFNTTGGAEDGTAGGINFGLVLPEATIPFKKNIDSVRINETIASCKTFGLDAIAYTNSSTIQTWQWSYSDGQGDTLQNTTHTFSNYGSHTIKLVATDINGCKDSVSKVVATNGINFDFVSEQDVCDPLKVRFKAIGDTTAEIYWSTGDGTITGMRNPAHIYPAAGLYPVEYSTGNAGTGCIDTVRKTIYIGWREANIILTPDTTICYGAGKLLRSAIDSTLPFCWSSPGFLNNVNFANPATSTTSTITYSLNAASEENNLVVNGDFSNGNTGFVTGHVYVPPGTALLSPGEYSIHTSTLIAGNGGADCKDHTGSNGNMLVVNADADEKTIWSQTITVTPNTNYSFSMWTQSPNITSKAILQLSINGNKMPDSIIMPAAGCIWKKYATQWNSGSNTTVQLSLIDRTVPAAIPGFDSYAIDDIRFSAFQIQKDTVRIAVDTPFINTRTDTVICQSDSVRLNTIGAVSYTWSPSTGLSNTAVADPVAAPGDTTTYFVTGINAFGCTATDSVTIFVKPSPAVSGTGDTSICFNTPVQLFATGGIRFEWTPGSLLSDPVSPTPVANPATNGVRYTVKVTGANNCSTKDSFLVSVNPLPVFTVSESKAACIDTKPQLNAAGGNYYVWSPASLVSNANIDDPLAITDRTTEYAVLIRDTTCGYDTTLTTTITILPRPVVTAGKENDITCTTGSSQLSAGGAVEYSWIPAATLNDPSIAKPLASPVNNTTYTVTGTDANGCTNTATVTVLTDYSSGASYAMPNAFSPNGDGRNDCFRPKYFGLITEFRLMIYNRWGQQVFYTNDPAGCWDGNYKGIPCKPGNYIYHLTAKTTCGNVERKGNVMLVR